LDRKGPPEAQAEPDFRIFLLRSPTAKEGHRIADHANRHRLPNVRHALPNSNEFLYID
jgi:hypothetical protein